MVNNISAENQVKYIAIEDSKGNKNLWRLQGLYNEDRYCLIDTRDCLVVIDKEAIEEPAEGSRLYTYKDIVNVENVRVSNISCERCMNCLYGDMCPDACKVSSECEYFLDYEDERLGLATEE